MIVGSVSKGQRTTQKLVQYLHSYITIHTMYLDYTHYQFQSSFHYSGRSWCHCQLADNRCYMWYYKFVQLQDYQNYMISFQQMVLTNFYIQYLKQHLKIRKCHKIHDGTSYVAQETGMYHSVNKHNIMWKKGHIHVHPVLSSVLLLKTR